MQPLPEALPADPLALFQEWLDRAIAELREHNPTAMSLSTLADDGAPASRMVICRGYDAQEGFIVFYTDRDSPKGLQLDARPHAAAIFYWEPLQRQVRIRGRVSRSPDAESDAYFDSRPPGAQLSARASRQSQPVASRAELQRMHAEETARFEPGDPVPRPGRWGGYRIWIDEIEFWIGMPDRLHDRALYTRSATEGTPGSTTGWSSTRLQP
ncbi:MAG: pyridoxamine 5'-phosphate oxidase [Deltaproteobacteria bacterium]|nr:pyridoxamine 5'-phosphate oxidase [Deltaproteobacteria bacterium]MBW2412892.1 pyridoxamine 5'-phosphate oxidase [Deltaproteobacteria bacterium]